MRSVMIVCVLVCLALVASVANAAGQVSDAALAQAGLSSMNQMTDVQGLAIRGNGFAAVRGQSWALAPGAGTSQSYVGVSLTRNALAAGASVSAAATGGAVFTPWGSSGWVLGSAAGGGAIAYAK